MPTVNDTVCNCRRTVSFIDSSSGLYASSSSSSSSDVRVHVPYKDDEYDGRGSVYVGYAPYKDDDDAYDGREACSSVAMVYGG